MPIRQGIDKILKHNESVEKQLRRSSIPELVLYEDGDTAIMRILTDDPVDADIHQIFDDTIARGPLYSYCTRDEGNCDYCKIGRPARFFLFWVYVERIIHNTLRPGTDWHEEEIAGKKVYVEDLGKIRLLRRKFGKGKAQWIEFQSIFDAHGTWKNGVYSLKRYGIRNNPDKIDKLSLLETSPLPKVLAETISKLPPLSGVAKGDVLRLPDLGEMTTLPASATNRPKPAAPEPLLRKKIEVTLPPDKDDDDEGRE